MDHTASANRSGRAQIPPLEPVDDDEQTSDARRVPTLVYGGEVYQVFISTSHRRGAGAFGVVFTADMVGPQGGSTTVTTETVAVKIFKGPVPEWKLKLIGREVEAWKRLKHPHILPFYAMCQLGMQQLGLVSQLAPNGNMNEYILHNPTKDRLLLLLQVAEGLKFLHRTATLVHGDLKCSNILISADESALLADFGLSTFIYGDDPEDPEDPEEATNIGILNSGDAATSTINASTSTNIRMLNSPAFAAPELFSDDAYEAGIKNPAQAPRSKTVYSDSFAFGALIYEAYSGEEPWRGFRPQDIIYKVAIKGETPQRVVDNKLAIPIGDALWELCTKCWRREPIERPDCTEILETLMNVRQHQCAPPQTQAAPSGLDIGRSTRPPSRWHFWQSFSCVRA